MRILGRGLTLALLGLLVMAGAAVFGLNAVSANHGDLDSMNILTSTQENIGVGISAGQAEAISGDIRSDVSQIADSGGTCVGDVLVCSTNIVEVGLAVGIGGPALSFGNIGATNVVQTNVGATTQVAPNLNLNVSPTVNAPVNASPVINIGAP